MLLSNKSPLLAYADLPPSIQDWFESYCFEQLAKAGLQPDPSAYFLGLSESEQWVIIGELLAKARALPVAAQCPALTSQSVTFADIRNALKKPHIMLLGETGSGKSTLVKFLIAHATAPAIVLDSHAAPDDWQGLTVIGMGRQYEAIGCEVDRLVALMDKRYELRATGTKSFDPLIVVLDEFPACVANLGKSFTDNIMLLVRESRKVAIKLIVLAQGSEVKSLGIEGQGSIRECFALISIGKFAIEKAKSLKDETLKMAIASAQYPAMLDDYPCQLPEITSVNLRQLTLPNDYLTLTAIDELTRVDSPFLLKSASCQLSICQTAIVDYARRQGDFVSASKLKAGVRSLRDIPVNEIRNEFNFLAANGYGTVRGKNENLEFSAS